MHTSVDVHWFESLHAVPDGLPVTEHATPRPAAVHRFVPLFWQVPTPPVQTAFFVG